MKINVAKILSLIIITSFFILTSSQSSITFTKNIQFFDLDISEEKKITAIYDHNIEYNYLYIYPKNKDTGMNINKGNIKIYFKENSSQDPNINLNVNYLNSDYSTIDFNSGLFIEIKKLKYNSATLYIVPYGECHLVIEYQYTNDISFPSSFQYSNFQFNQFQLEKEAKITHFIQGLYNDYLLILSKTSLRNLEIVVTNKGIDVTEEKLAYLYPNGCSVFLDRKALKDNYIMVNINNKDKYTKEILLGYMHHIEKEIFPSPMVNGLQLYLEGNINKLSALLNLGNKAFEQYFTYQASSKNIIVEFHNSDTNKNIDYKIEDYNSMLHSKIDFNCEIRFQFGEPRRNALYIQYLDFSDINTAQKSLQPLVTGVPKSMIIPAGKSMYHYLPIQRDSSNLYYYLRAKNQETMYISYEACNNYPENCNFEGKQKNSVEVIFNIGLWHSVKTNRNELQLIYVYCEKECAYDILMTYDEDPFYLFPENNYTKFIGNIGTDFFALPVFEYFNTSKIESLYIDLIVLSGKADLTLKDGKDGNILDCSVTKVGNKQTYNISSDKFLSNKNYYKKEIYAIVGQNVNYKNTFYNIIYGTGKKNEKTLSNNIINMELLTVGNEDDEKNTFIFEYMGTDLYVSIASSSCRFKVNSDTTIYEYYSKTLTKTESFKITLFQEGTCIKGFKETIMLFTYSDTTKVLLSENTLINSKITKNVSFVHLFKPNNDNNVDNSFTIEIDRLSSESLNFNYKLEKMPIKENEEKSSASFNQTIITKKNKYISNKQIKDICGNDLCSLTINLGTSDTSLISLYLNKNGVNSAREINSAFIGTTNSKNPLFFYIDLDTNYDTELLINSYGQDLKYAWDLRKKEENQDKILPLTTTYSNVPNNHKIPIATKNCGNFCRLYIGVYAVNEDNSKNDAETTFSISYLIKDSKSSINLPLNYFIQYTLEDSTKVQFSINTLEDANVIFELDYIKQNENDNSEIEASINNAKFTSSEGRKSIEISKGETKITIENKNSDNKPTFKIRASTVGKKNVDVVPILSSYPEKCNTPPCYYLVDDFSPDNEQSSAFLYAPDTEDASITIKALDYTKTIDISGDFVSNTIKKNWYEHEIKDRNQKIIIKVDNGKNLTLCSSFYNKPNIVTLNYGEKRAFTISKNSIDNILFKIKKPTTNNYKLRINIHSIKGNGIFKIQNEAYPIGLDSAYKEDISIVLDNLSNDLEIKASNEKDNEEKNDNDFSFSIYYIIDITSQFYYPIKSDSINSFKFNSNEKLTNLFFYLEVNKDNDLNMNIKIYSDSSTYEIKSYIVETDFINKKSVSPSNELGEIQTFIQGGSSTTGKLTFSKLEISKDALTPKITETMKYILIKISQKDQISNKVNIDLYPYGMNNNRPLARNELFIEKLPRESVNHSLLLVKSEFDYKVNSKIDFVPPSSKKYKRGIGKSNKSQKDNIRKEEEIVINTNSELGKEIITLQSESDNKNPYILFNIFSEENNKETNDDLFLLRYRNQANDDKLFIPNKEYFKVEGTANNVTFEINGFTPVYSTGKNVLILNAYSKNDVEGLNMDNKYKPLYLLFNKGIKPVFTHYKVLEFNMYQSNIRTHYETNINGGDYYFTAISVIEDNGREEYIAYEGKYFQLEGSDLIGGLLDYMRNHIFATILIIIILLFVLGALLNICRAERKARLRATVKESDMPNEILLENKEE